MQLAGNEMQFASTPSPDGSVLLPKAPKPCLSLEPAPCGAGREGWGLGRRDGGREGRKEEPPESLSKY